MKTDFLKRLTPRATTRTRLFSAALVWSLIGAILALKGFSTPHGEPARWVAPVLGLGLGILKSRLVLDKAAHKISEHINAKPTKACLGGLFSIWNWALIALMAILGKTLGSLQFPQEVRAAVYLMVGSGLACSSRLLWSAWRHAASHGSRCP